VYAFEPQPSLARAIAVTAKLNGFAGLHIFPIMLGKVSGQASLFVPAHSIHASVVSREAGALEISCPVATLDDLVATGRLPPPDVIKIDVEGSEWDVFQGARQTLAAKRPVIIFESDVNSIRFKYTRRQLCGLLRETGPYRFYSIDGNRLVSADERMDDPFVTDMVAVPPEIAVA
jgi:FkbM family methyltransferase